MYSIYNVYCLFVFLGEEPPVLALKIRCEHSPTDIFRYLIGRPKTTAIEFLGARTDVAIVDTAVDIDELTLALTLEDIVTEALGGEIGDAEFLADLALQGPLDVLTEVDMSADGGIPLSRLDILPVGTALKIEIATAVEYMKMDHGVENLTAVVGMAARDGSENVARLVDDGQLFVWIISHYVSFFC